MEQAPMTDEQKAVEQVATPRCDSLNLDDHRFNDIREWRKLAHDCERELTAANAQCEALKRESAAQHMIAIRADHERRAAESLVSAAPPEGMVEVPVEPTGQMVEAAERLDAEWRRKFSGLTTGATVGEVYKAMIAARPVAAPLREALAELVRANDALKRLCRAKPAASLAEMERASQRIDEAFEAARALLEDGKC